MELSSKKRRFIGHVEMRSRATNHEIIRCSNFRVIYAYIMFRVYSQVFIVITIVVPKVLSYRSV